MAAGASGAVDKTVSVDFYCISENCKVQCDFCIAESTR